MLPIPIRTFSHILQIARAASAATWQCYAIRSKNAWSSQFIRQTAVDKPDCVSGSLARESVRDTYSKGSWELFNQQVEDAGQPRGESIAQRPFGFYFLKPEIIPRNVYGVHRFTPEGEVIKEFEVSIVFTLIVPCQVHLY